MNTKLVWFKSSHSGTESGDCVEIAALPQAIHIRDSKRTDGPRLAIGAPGWARFIAHVAAS
ncbi:DUF397 domain-containing protein [Streptomyces sp. NPDC002537]